MGKMKAMHLHRGWQVHGGWRLLALFLAAMFLLSSGMPSSAAPLNQENGAFDTVILPASAMTWSMDSAVDQRAERNPKLDSALDDLTTAAASSSAATLALAESEALRMEGDQVHVQIVTHAAGVQQAMQAVAAAGGSVTGVGNADTLLQGWLPVTALESVAANPDVLLVRRPAELVQLEDVEVGAYTTEGLAVINGPAWHTAGRRGAGVKIGVIDGGFLGYSTLLGTDLPASVTVKNFVDGESDGQVDGSSRHGTACAEIIHDIAPDATLYLAKVGTNLDLQEAVAWLKDTHQVDIISTSLGWYNLTPGDGTGEFANLVQSARSAGILWVTAAGNDRQAHWGGAYSDPRSTGNLHYNPTQDVNYFGPGDGAAYNIPAGYRISVFLRWNDWSAVNQDYDLYLLRWNGSSWSTVASSQGFQNGGAGQTPTEYATVVTSGASTAYGFVVRRFNSNRNVNVEIFAPKVDRLDEIVTARSLANLADAPGAMTVAALDVVSPYPQEAYSSQGPTNGPGGAETGGATKPNIAAFANVSTVSYGTTNKFNGTSSATPHVAGAAALVQGAFPAYTPSQVQSFLEGRAIDMGAAGLDTLFGHGRLNLGTPPSTAIRVDSITPIGAPNTGSTAFALAGANFAAGATVKLIRTGQTDILATGVVVNNQALITGNFDLTGKAIGAWTVVATNPTMQSYSLVNGFSVTGPLSNRVYLPLAAKIPTATPPTATTRTLVAIADATILEGYASTNTGNTSDMWAGYDDMLDPDGRIVRSLIRFDLASIPTNATVQSAVLRVYFVGYYDFPNRSRTVTAHRITGDWTEFGVTWNNRPSPGTAYGSVDILANNSWGWRELNVRDLVQGWVNRSITNQGVMLRGPEASGTDSAFRAFSTRQGTYPPQLTITYIAAGSASTAADAELPVEAGISLSQYLGDPSVAGSTDGREYQAGGQ